MASGSGGSHKHLRRRMGQEAINFRVLTDHRDVDAAPSGPATACLSRNAGSARFLETGAAPTAGATGIIDTNLITFFCDGQSGIDMIWSALLPKALKPRSNRGRILLWSCLAGLIFGTIQAGVPLEEKLRDVRNEVRQHPVSGDITLVAIDDRSLNELGNFPSPRSHLAALADKPERLGAKRVVFDTLFTSKTDPQNDREFARS